MLQKLHGQTLHVSVSYYDKRIRTQQMHQEGTLTPAEVQTVDRSVREDMTLHSPSSNTSLRPPQKNSGG